MNSVKKNKMKTYSMIKVILINNSKILQRIKPIN